MQNKTPNTPTSHNLEVISNNPLDLNHPNQSAGHPERRRIPRLSVTEDQFKISQNGKIFPVVDLSRGGFAIRVLEKRDFALFTLGAAVVGTLNLHGNKYPVQARVRHLGRDMAGCEFESLSQEVVAAFKANLLPENLGKYLRPIPATRTDLLWYHGRSGTDLLINRTPAGDLEGLIAFFIGSFVQWDEGDGLSTGTSAHSFEASENHGAVRFESLLLNRDQSIDSDKLTIAKTLILSSNLPEDLKSWCVSQLSPPV